MLCIDVIATNSYQVIIGNSSASQLGEQLLTLLPKAQKVAIITDDNVKNLYLTSVKNQLLAAKLTGFVYSILPGEASKNGDNYLRMLSWLAKNDFTKTDIIIALGGGVVGDLAGFVAATYLRGVAYVQIPSTLLAMVDASVGGKTAIALPAGKNLVGAFYQPSLVLCDLDLLKTLPTGIMQEGYGEIIKYGMLGNKELLIDLTTDAIDLNEIVATCVKMKSAIVHADEFDQGVRKLLNFGHTIGHAIEQLSDYQIRHGVAVAMGMAIDTRAAVNLGTCNASVLTTLLNLLEKYQLPSQTNYSASDLFEAMRRDKKRTAELITNIVPTALGKCELEEISLKSLFEWVTIGMAR